MKAETKHALAAVLIGLCCAGVSGAAQAASDTDLRHAALRKACTEQGGRFALSWMYNDHGVKWGDVVSCSTELGNITCRGKVCRVNRRVLPYRKAASDSGQGGIEGPRQFPAEVADFYAALATLTDK